MFGLLTETKGIALVHVIGKNLFDFTLIVIIFCFHIVRHFFNLADSKLGRGLLDKALYSLLE